MRQKGFQAVPQQGLTAEVEKLLWYVAADPEPIARRDDESDGLRHSISIQVARRHAHLKIRQDDADRYLSDR
jgi:hypothetical protein